MDRNRVGPDKINPQLGLYHHFPDKNRVEPDRYQNVNQNPD